MAGVVRRRRRAPGRARLPDRAASTSARTSSSVDCCTAARSSPSAPPRSASWSPRTSTASTRSSPGSSPGPPTTAASTCTAPSTPAAEARRAVADAFAAIDVLALPTTPGHGDARRGPRRPRRAQPVPRHADDVRQPGRPGLRRPCRWPPDVPAGLQLIGPAWSDDELAALADGYETRRPGRPRSGRARSSSSAPTSTGQPLNHQLTVARRACCAGRRPRRRRTGCTSWPAPCRRKPGLVRTPTAARRSRSSCGRSRRRRSARSCSTCPPPLAIGTVELADGSWWKGFVCEPTALAGATDITATGGWRRHLATTT